ncbi:hypothetical protein [Mucilaginibacter segetis]|uniref:Uncharacterized protein n=1 Tax=Mucilaginibacter segetis TaxID=2793071 RepID=A0A934ULL5_9SPHI|nr:hypothetical protein [Mucilaginibacter segetis]MBK0378085.1 hypothetical protein [Mucilaginibacter segetis]
MILNRSKKVLLVAPKAFPDKLLAGYSNVKHTQAINKIFPSIHEVKPDVILFDYAHMGTYMETVLRRLQTNSFYKNIKICCYKNASNEKTDSFLKILGVKYFIYKEDLQDESNSKTGTSTINNVLGNPILNLMSQFS